MYAAACGAARAEYARACRSTWVKHFDRLYGSKKRVERLLELPPQQRTAAAAAAPVGERAP
eukprot:SM004372S15739  [mRNA]  locus=s4372:69:405:+ [translate_table: standard]